MAMMGETLKKAQYYVWYLGWKDCRGMGGREYTEPIVKRMAVQRAGEDLPKLTVEVSKKELKITQLTENKKGKIEKRKYPSVPARDVTYAAQGLSPDGDIVACIFLGFNPQTRSAMHVHVYRCDSRETAAMFVSHLNHIIDIPEHRKRAQKVEEELVKKGQIEPRPTGLVDRTGSQEDDAVCEHIDTAPDKHHKRSGSGDGDTFAFDSLTAELNARFGQKSAKAPLLLPARDYDTWHRNRGNFLDVDDRKCKNVDLVGVKGACDLRKPSSGGGDSARGDSEWGSNRNSHSPPSSANVRSPDVERPIDPHAECERDNRDIPDVDRNPAYEDRNPAYEDRNPAYEDSWRQESDDMQAISPRWKTTGQVYAAPHSPRASRSPERASPPIYTFSQRPFSPGPYTRDLKNSYLSKNSGFTDHYLHEAPQRYEDYLTQSPSVYISDLGRRLYHPTALGLTGRDEGYRSLDRRDARYSDGAYPADYGPPALPHDARVGGSFDDVPVDYTVSMRPTRRLNRASDYY